MVKVEFLGDYLDYRMLYPDLANDGWKEYYISTDLDDLKSVCFSNIHEYRIFRFRNDFGAMVYVALERRLKKQRKKRKTR
jgi:hypothetical protein